MQHTSNIRPGYSLFVYILYVVSYTLDMSYLINSLWNILNLSYLNKFLANHFLDRDIGIFVIFLHSGLKLHYTNYSLLQKYFINVLWVICKYCLKIIANFYVLKDRTLINNNKPILNVQNYKAYKKNTIPEFSRILVSGSTDKTL